MDANDRDRLHDAIRGAEESRRHLTALYLSISPDDPGYEDAVAETILPAHLRPLSESLIATYKCLLELRDYMVGISILSHRLAELVAWTERETMDAYRLRVERAEKAMNKHARDILAQHRRAMLDATTPIEGR